MAKRRSKKIAAPRRKRRAVTPPPARRPVLTRERRRRALLGLRRKRARQGWVTRRQRQWAREAAAWAREQRQKEQRLAEKRRQPAGWTVAENTRMKRLLHYGAARAPWTYDEMTPELVGAALAALMDDGRKLFYTDPPNTDHKHEHSPWRAKPEFDWAWGGGYIARLSTRDDSEGKPIWEEELYRQASAYLSDFDRARRNSIAKVEQIAKGERREDFGHHYYRIWIVGVTCHIVGPRIEGPDKPWPARGGKQRRLTP